MSKLWSPTACAGVVLALLAACGGSPTGAANGAGSDDTLNAVLAKVDGLRGAERTDKLVELAKQDGGAVSFYTALTSQLANKVREKFADEYGITVKVYRSSNEDLVKRLLQESSAGKVAGDLIETGGPDMVTLHREKVLAPYRSPARRDLVKDAVVQDTWTGSRIQVFAPAWNSEHVDTPPTSWEDLADDRWNGKLAMETGNSDWYMALSDYWTEEAGKSPDEVKALWRDIARGTTMISGHSTMRELMVSGEFAAAATLYSYMTEESAAKGAPLEWQPTVSPLITRTQGAAIPKGAPNPAGAVLLMDWLIARDGGQKLFVDSGIDSVRKDLWDLKGETYPVDVVRYVDNMGKLQDEFEKLTRLGDKAEGS